MTLHHQNSGTQPVSAAGGTRSSNSEVRRHRHLNQVLLCNGPEPPQPRPGADQKELRALVLWLIALAIAAACLTVAGLST